MYAFGRKARNGEYDSRRQDAEEDDCLLESCGADGVDAALRDVLRDALPLGERLLYQGLLAELKSCLRLLLYMVVQSDLHWKCSICT